MASFILLLILFISVVGFFNKFFYRDSDSETDSSERPVQGPLPFEPEDAPWKRNETSGIRKFFRRVFGATVPAEEAEICDQESSSGSRNSGWSKNYRKLLLHSNVNIHLLSDVCEGIPV